MASFCTGTNQAASRSSSWGATPASTGQTRASPARGGRERAWPRGAVEHRCGRGDRRRAGKGGKRGEETRDRIAKTAFAVRLGLFGRVEGGDFDKGVERPGNKGEALDVEERFLSC